MVSHLIRVDLLFIVDIHRANPVFVGTIAISMCHGKLMELTPAVSVYLEVLCSEKSSLTLNYIIQEHSCV